MNDPFIKINPSPTRPEWIIILFIELLLPMI